jgi:hypothetical protein
VPDVPLLLEVQNFIDPSSPSGNNFSNVSFQHSNYDSILFFNIDLFLVSNLALGRPKSKYCVLLTQKGALSD